MATTYTISKRYNDFGGVNKSLGAILESPQPAEVAKNAQRLRTGTLTSRKGDKVICDEQGGLGLFSYGNVAVDTGVITNEILAVGQKLYRVKDGTVTITYTGSGTSVYASMLVDATTNTWKFCLVVDSVEEVSSDLGIGYDEATPVTLANLKTTVDAHADFTMAISGTTSTPAAFLPQFAQESFTSGSLAITFKEYEEVNQPTSGPNPFAAVWAKRNTAAEAEPVSSVNLRNVKYFGTGFDELVKYDGVDCYRAGMPQPSAVASLALVGSGSITDTGVKYIYTYIQKDAKGNTVEGINSGESASVSPTAQDINVTVTNIQNSTGFNTDCAIVAGAQAGVTTITVDDGSGGSHTMKVGQTAYFYDGVSGDYVEREITAVAATTITISGANVNVADNAVISNNLRIALYRTTASGSDFYYVTEIPNDSFSATQVHTDSVASVSSNAVFTDPAELGVEHGLPPKGKYLAPFRDSLIVAGDPERVNTFYWSDIFPEYFPTSFSDIVQSRQGGKIKGIYPAQEFLIVAQDKATHQVVGELRDGSYRIDNISEQVGCVANAAFVERNGVVLMLSEEGVYPILGGTIGESISKDINEALLAPNSSFVLERSTAVIDEINDQYLLFIPVEATTGGRIGATDESRVFVYDFRFGSWWEWTDMNAGGGMVIVDDELYFAERREASFDSSLHYVLRQRLNSDTDYDYTTHDATCSAIDWEYMTGWETGGEPSIAKKFLRFKGFSTDPNYVGNFTLGVETNWDFKSPAKTDTTVSFGGGDASMAWALSGWGFLPFGGTSSPTHRPKKLKSGKAYAHRYRFTHSTRYARPLLSAFETEIAAPYRVKVDF